MTETEEAATAEDRHEFIVGDVPYLATEPDTLEVGTRAGIIRARGARACGSWGEFATYCGLEWQQLLEDHGDEIREILEGEEPDPASAFDFLSLWGLWYVLDFIEDPRQVAADALGSLLPREVWEDPRLAERLVWGDCSPSPGSIQTVQLVGPDALEVLQQVLEEHELGNIVFVRDDALFESAFTDETD